MHAFEKLTLNESFPWHRVIRWIESDERERKQILSDTLPEILKAPEMNSRLAEAVLEMDRAAAEMAAERRPVTHTFRTAAEGVRVLNEAGLALAARYVNPEIPHQDPAVLAAETEKWYHEYIRVWESTCRRSTLERTRRLMDTLADILRNR